MFDRMLSLEKTNRGFAVGRFIDRYGSQCSVQKSSLACENAIWLGVDIPFSGGEGVRMHLTQDMVLALLPHLVSFVDTGELVSSSDVGGS